MPEGSRRLGEFELIGRLFAPLAGPGGLGLEDDAALIEPPDGCDLVATKDMTVSGVHFLPDDPADLVARKLLRVNLSDLAAMGASPQGYLLGLSLPPEIGDDWLIAFAAGLARDQAEFGIALLGGDTTSTPGPLTLSLTALGVVSRGKILRRAGASPGDAVFVSGTIGDGALGLLALRGEVEDRDGYLAGRYRLPVPRLALGGGLPGVASAGLDISDGLVADLGHLCAASGMGAIIEAARIPLSDSVRRLVEGRPALMASVLTGGDDYELVFSAPPSAVPAIETLSARAGVAVTRIGSIEEGEGVRVRDGEGRDITPEVPGFRHR
ncbi:MAG: thiamine-phosphate kinase [Sphingomonadales bacterium]